MNHQPEKKQSRFKNKIREIKNMKKENLPLIIIIASLILIVVNFIFTSNEMDLAFWMRILSSGLSILAMFLIIRDRKKQSEKKSN